MYIKTVKNILDRIKIVKPEILVLGDVMLDNYIHGEVERISPEAPVPILNYQKRERVLGGAGNVARNLVNLGAKVTIASIIGDDSTGLKVKGLLEGRNVFTDLLLIKNGVKTTKKTRFLCNDNQLLRVDNDSEGIKKSDFKHLETELLKKISIFDSIIISDYNKGVCNPSIIKKIIKEFRTNNDNKVFIDPKGKKWDKYSGSGCITPNTKEVEALLGIKLIKDEDFEKASLAIRKKYKIETCLITRGSDGMTYNSDHYTQHQKVGKKIVYDVSGAGDTVIASLAATQSSGFEINECLEFCGFVSSEVVTHIGTTPFQLNMIKKKINN